MTYIPRKKQPNGPPKPCEQCFNVIPATWQSNQKYCSPACAKLASIPGYLVYKAAKYQQNQYRLFCRDQFRCIYCGKSSIEDHSILTVDHVIPKNRNGPNTAENLVTSCKPCNTSKTDNGLPPEALVRVQDEVAKRNREHEIQPTQLFKV